MIQSNTIDNAEVEIRQYYYETGALLAEAPYVEGKRHGIERGYTTLGVSICGWKDARDREVLRCR